MKQKDTDKVKTRYGTNQDDDIPYRHGEAGKQTGHRPSLPDCRNKNNFVPFQLTELAKKIIEKANGK